MEFAILDFLQTIHMPWLDRTMIFITGLGNKGLFFIAVAVILLIFKKHRKAGICILISIVIEVLLCNILLKPLVHRIRPYDVNIAVDTLIKRPKDFSFPSGHTGVSFAAAFALFFQKDRLWIPTAILAVMIGFSRMYLYIHYPTDVLAGAVVGIAAGYLGAWIISKLSDETA